MITATDPVPPMWLRVLRFPLTRLVVLGSALIFMMAVTEDYDQQFKSSPLVAIAMTIGLGLLALAVYAGWAIFIERRAVSELSLPGMGREWATGALIGAGLYTACVLILIALGMYRIDGFNPWTFLIPAIPMALKSGLFEELAFRGVMFQSIEALAGSWIAIAVSSFVFGFLHLTNTGGTLTGAIYITIEAGLLLAAAYLITRRLWLAIGYHMSWNYTQSAVFSGIVSGAVDDPGLLRTTAQGPTILTGGSFGMESSLVAFVLCTATGLVLLAIAYRRGHIRPPPWKVRRT
jgi:membrane protease YdiL (CAAX protease family)